MNIDRLLKLADALERNANNPEGVTFDLTHWAFNNKSNTRPGTDWNLPQEFLFDGGPIPLSCDTAACAIGYAALSGLFKEEGLTYELQQGRVIPIFGIYCNWPAIELFFDLTLEEVYYLFTASAYMVNVGKEAELAVVSRIRAFVLGGRQ